MGKFQENQRVELEGRGSTPTNPLYTARTVGELFFREQRLPVVDGAIDRGVTVIVTQDVRLQKIVVNNDFTGLIEIQEIVSDSTTILGEATVENSQSTVYYPATDNLVISNGDSQLQIHLSGSSSASEMVIQVFLGGL